jgi:tRNA/tmRNA/rRNA uracil-C5-methylase (TrmA/RlmC/RlmD family)
VGTVLWTSSCSVFARQVVAVEINKFLCQAAEHNLSLNDISNVTIIKCDSGEFARKILRNRSYAGKDGTEYRFGGVLVDPPRAGLDVLTRRLVKNYHDIIYISCNPEALARDLSEVFPVSCIFFHSAIVQGQPSSRKVCHL